MDNYPQISPGQYTVRFLDRNTGIILDKDFKAALTGVSDVFYTVHDSLRKAMIYAESRISEVEHSGINPGYLISDYIGMPVLHTDILNNGDSGQKKALIINGNNFTDLDGFYTEADKILTSELDWKTGHNLNAFNDLLRGGFGVHEYGEPFILIWMHAGKSKADLADVIDGQTRYEILAEIIRLHPHIEFIEE